MGKYNANAFGDVLEKAGKQTADFVKNAVQGQKMNGTNKAINKIAAGVGNNAFGGAEAIYRMAREGQGFSESLIRTFGKDVVKEGDRLVAKGGYNYGKIAGSYIGAAAAGRVITGGGLTKDGQGRQNLIGVPFV